MREAAAAFGLVVLMAASATHGQPPQPAFAPAPSSACCLIAAGTPIEIELTESVSSKVVKSGDRFGIKLATDLQFDGATILAAGAQGYGEVVDVAPGGLAGRPGKLILAARALTSGAVTLPLRSFKLAASGRDNSKIATTLMATPYAGVLALGIQGGNVDYPQGTRAIAKVAADTLIASPVPPPARPSTLPTPDPKEKAQ